MPAYMFHYFCQERDNQMGSVLDKDFINFIEKKGVDNFVTPEEYLCGGMQGKVLITVDDGLRNQYDIAKPILDFYNIKAIWFVNGGSSELPNLNEVIRAKSMSMFGSKYQYISAFLEAMGNKGYVIKEANERFKLTNYLNWADFYSDEEKFFKYIRDVYLTKSEFISISMEILDIEHRNIKKSDYWINESELYGLHLSGHTIGLHGATHLSNLSGITEREQFLEYKENFDYINAITHIKPWVASYPCGNYDQYSKVILTKLGIKYSFKANNLYSDSQFELPRVDSSNINFF